MHALVLIDVLAYFCSFSIASLRRVPPCSYSSLCFYLLALGFLSFAFLNVPLCYPQCFPLFPWCFPPIFLKLSSGSPTACLLSSCGFHLISCGFPMVFLWLSWASPVVFCSLACCFLMPFSWRSCYFPMVLTCLSYVFLWRCAFLLTFSIKKSINNWSKWHQFLDALFCIVL